MAETVLATEPGCLSYYGVKPEGKNEIVLVEK
jgi:quinol monooxygenase YgiN